MRNEKVTSITEAARFIKSGDIIIIGGFTISMHPMALIRQIIRNKVNNLTVVGFSNGNDVDLLAAVGSVKQVESSSVTFEMLGLAPNYRRAVQNGEIVVKDYTETTIAARAYAGSMGLTFYPTRALLGCDSVKYMPEIKELKCPITGEFYHAIPALNADVAIFHAIAADAFGNVLYPQTGNSLAATEPMFSRAAKKVVVTVDKIVDHDVVLRNPEAVLIPGFEVDAVVELPFGAHPCGWPNIYEHDIDHLREYMESSKNPESLKKYLDRFVYEAEDHWDYLERVGGLKRLMQLRLFPGGLNLL